MTPEAFQKELRTYVGQVLAGICADPGAIRLAVDVNPRGTFMLAKVAEGDYDPLKFDGGLEAVKALVERFGELRPNDREHGRPFAAFFQLFNPALAAAFPSDPAGAPGG